MKPHELAIGRIFRWAGVAALLAAGARFLVEGWTDPRALPRQVAWAALTLALVSSGVLSARRFRDALGARICLGLAAASIPLHFAQLGSSWFELHHGGLTTKISGWLSAAIVILLLPVLAVGGAALVRRWALPFTALLFALGGPLSLTSRAGDRCAWLALGELAFLLCLELFFLARRVDLQGAPGGAVRGLLCLPLCILLGRNAFYEMTPLWLAAVLASLGVLLLVGAKWLAEAEPFRVGAELLGALLLAVAGALAGASWPIQGVTVAFALWVALAVSRDSASMRVVGYLGTMALGVAAAAGFGAAHPSTAILGLVVSLGYLALSYRRRALGLCVSSGVGAFALTASLLVSWLTFPAYFGWLIPAGVGLSLLVLGSSMQSPHGRCSRVWSHLTAHFFNSASEQRAA